MPILGLPLGLLPIIFVSITCFIGWIYTFYLQRLVQRFYRDIMNELNDVFDTSN